MAPLLHPRISLSQGVTIPDADMTVTDRQAAAFARHLTSANDLLQARLQRRISRRALIARAAELGLASPVVALLLHATGDAAVGAPILTRHVAAGLIRQEATPVPATERTEPAGTPLDGGTLTIGLVGTIGTAAPYMVNHALNPLGAIQPAFLEGLLAFDSQQRIRPALAESYEIADDGVTYTFTLREGVLFHNGEPLTSRDVTATWELIVDPDLPIWTRAGWDRIEQIETPDERTVIITTREVFAPFLSYLAAGSLANSVICPASLIGTDRAQFEERFNAEPVGTGAFQIATIQPNQIELVRFDDYWRQGPVLDSLVVRFFPDYETQLAALREGEIDLIGRTGDLSDPRVEAAREIPGVTVLDYPAMTWGHLDLKQIGLLRERRVRQALDYATPKERIVDEILDGHAIVAIADQAPGTWAHAEIEGRAYDPDRAGELLDEIGVVLDEDGVRARDGERLAIQLWAERGDSQGERIIEMIAESWREIGVEATTHYDDPLRLSGPTGYQFTDRMTAGYYRWENLNDPDHMLYWHSSQIPTSPTGAGGNLPAFFFDYEFQDEIDDLTSRAATELDQVERAAIYAEIQELLRDEVPVIFLFWDKHYTAAIDRLGGFWPSAYTQLLWNARQWYLVE